MVGSVDAPEPGFRPGVRWGFWHALAGSGVLGGWRVLGAWCALAGSGALGLGFPW